MTSPAPRIGQWGRRAEHVIAADGVVELVGQPEPVRGVPGHLARIAQPGSPVRMSTLPVAISMRATESPPQLTSSAPSGADGDAGRLNQPRLGWDQDAARAIGAWQ